MEELTILYLLITPTSLIKKKLASGRHDCVKAKGRQAFRTSGQRVPESGE